MNAYDTIEAQKVAVFEISVQQLLAYAIHTHISRAGSNIVFRSLTSSHLFNNIVESTLFRQ